MSYHGECHAVDLVFVFGLVLSEGTVPEQEREDRQRHWLQVIGKRRGGGHEMKDEEQTTHNLS